MSSDTNVRILKRLLAYARPYCYYLAGALISAVLSVTLALLIPVLIGRAVDHMIGEEKVVFQGILVTIAYLGAAIAGSTLFQWLMSFYTNRITFYTVKDLRLRAYDKLNKVPLKVIDSNAHGNILHTIVNDIDIISDGLLHVFTQFFSAVVTVLGTIAFMLSIHVGIGITVIILTPLSLFVAAFITGRAYRKFKEQSAIKGELSGLIEELIGNQKLVKAFQYESRARERFEEINHRLHVSGVMAQFYSALTNPSTRFVNGIVYAAVGILGALQAIAGRITVGQLTSFLAYASQYTKPFNEISGVVTELQSALASAGRVFALIDEEPEIEDAKLLEHVQTDGTISMKCISFSYLKEKPLIRDLNLNIAAGQKVAIVGPTGSGKTTIINLLMRFYDVDYGKIEINGIDIRKMKRKTLRSMFGMVLQDTWLFQGTVRENIAYGKEGAKEDEIIEAAKAAYAHSFIKRLPQGYDTVITEEGNISQGQKQLLSIARVMLTRPPILLLDEATSNIDTRTELRIQKALSKLMEGRTSFIVAHRLSTVKESDIILVMNNGTIIEQGSHEELLASGGFYSKLYYSQFVQSEE